MTHPVLLHTHTSEPQQDTKRISVTVTATHKWDHMITSASQTFPIRKSHTPLQLTSHIPHTHTGRVPLTVSAHRLQITSMISIHNSHCNIRNETACRPQPCCPFWSLRVTQAHTHPTHTPCLLGGGFGGGEYHLRA